MKHTMPIMAALSGLVALSLSACGGTSDATAQQPTTAAKPTVAATAQPATTSVPADAANPSLELGISGVGEVKAARDAALVFTSQGTVAEVKVKEGDAVKQGDLLAILDTRTFDQQVAQAEAALASAQAQEAGLTEPAKVADAAAARAAVAQAQAQLNSVKSGAKSQDIQSAQAGLGAAQANLQSTKDKLSLAKTQAESQLEQAVQALTAAQARYAQAKYNWEYVQDTGNDPIQTSSTNPTTGKKSPNKLTEGQRQNYASQFQQAEAALNQAQESVKLAQASFETAQQSEVTGIAGAEQQLNQSQASVDKITAPADAAQLAAAQAALAQARASQARLVPDPTKAQRAQVSAAIAQTQAALELAKISRERAEIRAPFDGLVSIVSIDPGDSSTVVGGPAIKLVDVSTLHLDVQISDIDIAQVKEGQKADVRADALPETVFSGRVTYIAPTASINANLRSYLVRVALDKQDGLRAGMSARVDITPVK